jgi:pimeloyl-ACP methyl ester carboxylesterase
MKPSNVIRTLRLLGGYLIHPRGPRNNVAESRHFDATSPFPTIVYSPKVSHQRAIVLVHGVTARATDDPSLVQLARAIASLGYYCVTPPLTHLAQFSHDARDIEAVARGIERAAHLVQRPVGVLGFSYGASFALCAAAHPLARSHCSAVLGFGAYYDLQAALNHQLELLQRNIDLTQDDADLAYLRYTLIACQKDPLPLAPDAWNEIRDILNRFTSQTPIEEKRAPLLKHAKSVDYVQLMRNYQAFDLPAEVSPKTSVANIACPVGLLHDPEDRFVPKTEVERLREALDQRPGVAKTQVLTTPMLSHVQVDPRKNLRDLPKLVKLLDLVLD